MIANRPRKGVTFVELMVVVAILAILLALLMPTFARSKEEAKIARSKSNMKQIHVALISYCNEYDGTYRSLPIHPLEFGKRYKLQGVRNTGGRWRPGHDHSDVYTWLWPIEHHLGPSEWTMYAESVADPAIMLDETFPGTSEIGPFVTVRVIGLTFSGSVSSKMCRGIPGLCYKQWR